MMSYYYSIPPCWCQRAGQVERMRWASIRRQPQHAQIRADCVEHLEHILVALPEAAVRAPGADHFGWLLGERGLLDVAHVHLLDLFRLFVRLEISRLCGAERKEIDDGQRAVPPRACEVHAAANCWIV